MLCPETKEFWKRFIENLLIGLMKNKLRIIEHEDSFNMIEDALAHLEKGNEEERACY